MPPDSSWRASSSPPPSLSADPGSAPPPERDSTCSVRIECERELASLHCVAATARTEGVLALYKGFLPVYGRQAPFNLLNFLIMEHLLDLARPGTT